MEPRRGQRRARRTGMPARPPRSPAISPASMPAPYAVGEDVTAATGDQPPANADTSRDHRRPERTRRTQRRIAAAASHLTAGDEALIPSEARKARWRRPTRRQVALARVAHVARVGARSAGGRLRRIPPGRAIYLGIPLTLAVALLVWMFAGSYWQARSVRIQGTSDPTLLALVHAQRLTGCNVFRCDFSAARQAIAASPRAQSVSITIVYPETTLVKITPRQTVALWQTQGETWAIGADGVIVGSIQAEPSLVGKGAVVVNDPGGVDCAGRTPRPGARMDAALVAMARQLRISVTSAGLHLTSLRYSAKDGFTMAASESGALVLFGGPADAQATVADLTSATSATPASESVVVTPAQAEQGTKLQVEAAGAILARLAQSGASASVIDVRWGSHPYYR